MDILIRPLAYLKHVPIMICYYLTNFIVGRGKDQRLIDSTELSWEGAPIHPFNWKQWSDTPSSQLEWSTTDSKVDLPADPVGRVKGDPVKSCCKVSMLFRLSPADDVIPGSWWRPGMDGACAAEPTLVGTPESPPSCDGSCGSVWKEITIHFNQGSSFSNKWANLGPFFVYFYSFQKQILKKKVESSAGFEFRLSEQKASTLTIDQHHHGPFSGFLIEPYWPGKSTNDCSVTRLGHFVSSRWQFSHKNCPNIWTLLGSFKNVILK